MKHPGLEAYAELVRRWAERIDLVAPGDLERFEDRHVSDSLKALPLVEIAPAGPCIDVGAGAGRPGIPLAIADPSRPWRLLEPRAKRAAFLDEAVRVLRLENCEVLRLRAEDAAADPGLAGAHALATARALASPEVAFPLLVPLLCAGGIAAVWVGASADIPSNAAVGPPGIATVKAE